MGILFPDYLFFDEIESLKLLLTPPAPITGVSRIFGGHFLFFDEDLTSIPMRQIVTAPVVASSGRNQRQIKRKLAKIIDEEDAFMLLD